VDPRKHEGELLTRLRSLTTRSPALPDAFDLLARTLASSHAHLTEAETVARDALARWPERAESLQTFGRVLLAQGKAEAFEVLEKAAGLLASRPEVQLDLAEAALMAGHADAASAAITKAQSLLQGVDRKEPRQRLLALAAKLPGAAPTRRGSLQATRPH
jgi:predicted Zn-dependent protease